MKTTLSIIFFFAFMFWLSEPKINFQLWTIKINNPYATIGIFFLTLAIFCFMKEGEKKGFRDGVNATNEVYKIEVNK